MATQQITIRTHSGIETRNGRSIPKTDGVFAAVHVDKECWSVTHRASGFAVVHVCSREVAIAAGQAIWADTPQDIRTWICACGPDLPKQMARDKKRRKAWAEATHKARLHAGYAKNAADYFLRYGVARFGHGGV